MFSTAPRWIVSFVTAALLLAAAAIRPVQSADDDKAAAEKAARQKSAKNLEQLVGAMHNYNDTRGHLPLAASKDKKGKPLLSWRVAILPFIDQEKLYKEFHQDEPWDSAHNKKLLAKMPKVFAPVLGKPKQPHSTYYQVFTGEGALGGNDPVRIPRSFPDGLSNTILIIEAGEAVPWTKPADLNYQPNMVIPKLGGQFKDGFCVGMADGSGKFFKREKLKEDTLRALITPATGDVVGADAIEAIERWPAPAIKPVQSADDDKADPEKAARRKAVNNLRQLALAMHNYNETRGHLPLAASKDKKGKPLLSWRVAILPFIDEEKLYKEFHQDEPWDSAHNKKLLAKMPKIFAPVRGKPKQAHSTYYQVFTGEGAFGGEAAPRFPATFVDGTSNTILIVEAGEAVPWTKPIDLDYQPKMAIPTLGGQFKDVFCVAMADGSAVFFLNRKKLTEYNLRAAITPAAGDIVGRDFEAARER